MEGEDTKGEDTKGEDTKGEDTKGEDSTGRELVKVTQTLYFAEHELVLTTRKPKDDVLKRWDLQSMICDPNSEDLYVLYPKVYKRYEDFASAFQRYSECGWF